MHRVKAYLTSWSCTCGAREEDTQTARADATAHALGNTPSVLKVITYHSDEETKGKWRNG